MLNIPENYSFIKDSGLLALGSWVALALSIVALPLSIYFYKKGSKVKLPSCIMFSHSIAGSMLLNVPELSIIYRGKQVKSLVLTKIVFWNAGSETLSKVDIPNKSPFVVNLAGDGEILSCKLDFVKNASNDTSVEISEDRKNIHIDFDYFDKNEGFVLELLHNSEEDIKPELSANFKGAKKLVHKNALPFLLTKPFSDIMTSEMRPVIGILILIVPPVQLFGSYFGYFPEWFAASMAPRSILDWIIIIPMLIFSSVLGWYLWRTRLPKGFIVKWRD